MGKLSSWGEKQGVEVTLSHSSLSDLKKKQVGTRDRCDVRTGGTVRTLGIP